MVFKFGAIAADRSVEIQIYFVTGSEDDVVRLAERFVSSAYRIDVTWVQADIKAAAVIRDAMAARQSWSPSAIILDYTSFGHSLWNFFWGLRQGLGDRYVEYVVFDLPDDEIERPELQAANVTAIAMSSDHTRSSAHTSQ